MCRLIHQRIPQLPGQLHPPHHQEPQSNSLYNPWSNPYSSQATTAELFGLNALPHTVFKNYSSTHLKCLTSDAKSMPSTGTSCPSTAPSLTICIDGCAAYNTWQITNSLPRALNCFGVTYTIRMGIWGNCFSQQAGNVLRMSESAACTYAKLRTP